MIMKMFFLDSNSLFWWPPLEGLQRDNVNHKNMLNYIYLLESKNKNYNNGLQDTVISN